MKIVISAVAIVVLMIVFPMEKQQSAFAISAFESGFQHGGMDGYDKCPHPDGCHWYILQPGKSFKFHSREFVQGYVNGFCSIAGSHMSSDDDQAMWDCRFGRVSFVGE